MASCKNFVSECQEFIFNAFINLELVQRSEDGCDMRRFRSFHRSTCTCKTFLNLLEAVCLRLRRIVVERVQSCSSQVESGQ